MKHTNRPPSLFDEYNKLDKLNHYKDPLMVLNENIDWESFRIIIESGYKQVEVIKGG